MGIGLFGLNGPYVPKHAILVRDDVNAHARILDRNVEVRIVWVREKRWSFAIPTHVLYTVTGPRGLVNPARRHAALEHLPKQEAVQIPLPPITVAIVRVVHRRQCTVRIGNVPLMVVGRSGLPGLSARRHVQGG